MFTFPITLFGGQGPRVVFGNTSGVGSSASTFNFTGMDLSLAEPSRFIVVGIEMQTSGTVFAINSVQIGASAFSNIVTRSDSGSTNKQRLALYGLALATGTTAQIDIVFAGSVTRCQIVTWALYNLSSNTAAHTANTGGGNSTTTASISIDVPGGGILLACGATFGTGGTDQVFTGVTVDSTQDSTRRQWGSYQAGAAETGRSVTYNGTAGADSSRTLVAASWS